jgi:hypothetical protein
MLYFKAAVTFPGSRDLFCRGYEQSDARLRKAEKGFIFQCILFVQYSMQMLCSTFPDAP